jgi:hypothetical protein
MRGELVHAPESHTARVVAASVLCFAVCPAGNVYFLLGKESAVHGLPSKADNWSDFGGRASRHDADYHDTAAREFAEESMGVLGDAETVARELRDDHYVCALSISMSSHTRHVCFVRQVAWAPEAPALFLRMRKMFLRIRNTSKKVNWLLRRRPDGQRLHLIDWVVHRAAEARTDMALSVRVTASEPLTLAVRFASPTGTYTRHIAALPGHVPADVQRYNTYLGLVLDMQRQYAALPEEWRRHPALQFTHWRGRLVRIVVCRHHLEMQCLRWWSLPYLHQLVQCNGRFRKNIIRQCFLPTLRLVLDYLATRHGTHDVVFTHEMGAAVESARVAVDSPT